MKTIFIFGLLLAVASAFDLRGLDFKLRKPIQPALAKGNPNERITHGKTAAANQFKYQVGLLMDTGDGNYWCGGSLIANEWVLTAAHCTVGIENATVQLGSNNRLEPAVTYSVSKESFIIHSKYDIVTQVNDIALIRIPAVKYTNAIQNVNLPAISSSYSTYEGDVAVASGWGHTSDASDDIPTELQYADFTVISNTLCQETYGPDGIDSGMMCAASTNSISVCQGDSGGPLVLKDTNILIGLVSFVGSDGCEMNDPFGLTRITSFLPWIKEKTGLPI